MDATAGNSKVISMELKIRKATNQDIPKIKVLIFNVLEEYGLVPDEMGIDRVLSDLDLNFFNDGGFFAVLVTPSDHIVGTIGIANKGDKIVELKKMFLTKEYRGKGYGKMMMNFIIEYARSHQYLIIQLETIRVLQEAINLYISYGFKPTTPKTISDRVDQAYELILK